MGYDAYLSMMNAMYMQVAKAKVSSHITKWWYVYEMWLWYDAKYMLCDHDTMLRLSYIIMILCHAFDMWTRNDDMLM